MKPLRPYQLACITAIYRFMETHDGHPLAVIPTGGGKSLVIATLCREALEQFPSTRIMVVTHVKELISQNYAELMDEWPGAPAGIYSAGLGRKETHQPIIFAGIQSIGKKGLNLPRIDLLLVDEAHLIPRKASTLYRKFFADLLAINPYLKIIGLTATPYRLDSGMLHQGVDAIFEDIAFNVSITHLIDNGWLVPLISLPADMQYDVSGVAKRGGEFIPGQLAKAVDIDDLTRVAVAEAVEKGADRRCWLFYGSSIDHCRHIRDAIKSHGHAAEVISAETPSVDRAAMVRRHKTGETKALVSMGVLTTGYNNPMVDMVAILRPTQSKGLYVQIVGRGSRLAAGKRDCLILDFGGNIDRHGPVDVIDAKAPGDGTGDAPFKKCPTCGVALPTATRECPECGHEFPPPKPAINAQASNGALLSRDQKRVDFEVKTIEYRRHSKPGKPPSMLVEYGNGLATAREWICFEHHGYPRQKAIDWWMKRWAKKGVTSLAQKVPDTVDYALDHTDRLAIPRKLQVRKNGKYLEIVGYDF